MSLRADIIRSVEQWAEKQFNRNAPKPWHYEVTQRRWDELAAELGTAMGLGTRGAEAIEMRCRFGAVKLVPIPECPGCGEPGHPA